MPWFEVIVKASQLIAVQAEDASAAANIAFERAFGNEDCDKECVHPCKEISGTKLESLMRHADLVLSEEKVGDGHAL